MKLGLGLVTRIGTMLLVVAALAAVSFSSAVAAPNLEDAAITVSPTSVVPNQQVSLVGTGFTPSTTIGGPGTGGRHQITGVGASVVTVAGTVLAPPSVQYPIDLDDSGNWVASIAIPVNPTSLLESTSQEIRAVDDQGVVATVTFTLPARSIAVTPDTGQRHSTFTVTGIGFPAANTLGSATTTVTISYAGTQVGNVSPDTAGAFTAEFLVPETAAIPSTNNVTASLIGFSIAETASHSVPGATITVSPSSGPPGSRVTVFGSNFPGFVPVSSINAGSLEILPSPAPNTDGIGSFTADVIIPGFPASSQVIRVLSSGTSAVANFTVTEGASVAPTPTPMPAAPGPSASPTTALQTLTNVENLLRVWYFDNATKVWSFFDPRPAFDSANSIESLVPGQPYWILVVRDQTVVLNAKSRTMFKGWNLIPW